MKTYSKRNNFAKNNPLSLGAVFLIFMDIVMLLTIIPMMGYFMQVSKTLMDKSLDERETVSKSIANVIYSATGDATKRKDFSTLSEIIRKLIDNKLINSVFIYDKGKVIWSSVPDMTGKKLSIKDIKAMYNNSYAIASNTRYERGIIANRYEVIIVYTLDSNLSYYIAFVSAKNPTLALLFILFGSLMVVVLIKLVTTPIGRLTDSVHIFAAGDFKHKISMSYYKELNILIRAFNEMAAIIYKTHASLEEKIKERTMELTDKNEQLNKAMGELKQTQVMLVNAEKMRSLGELVAGITHEINNPVNFIYGNLTHLKNYSQDLVDIIDKYKEYTELLPDSVKIEMNKLLEDKEYDYLKDDLPDLLKSCTEGTVRTKNIVMDLKNFSRTEKLVINEIDVNKEINTTLNILYNKYKNRITIHKEYSDIEPIDCYGGQLNQVFMNIIDNAIFAIKDTGDIFIRTKDVANSVVIEIEDTGSGIPKENIQKIFEPFFTTKGVGEGTGLGMSISYKIIETHGGKIDIDSELGRGTKFTITLPRDGLKKKGNEQNEL